MILSVRRSHLVAPLVAALSLSGALLGAGAVATTSTGCAAFIAAIPTVAEIVSDGVNIVAMIESAVTAYFAAHPSPAQQAIAAAIQRTRLALQAGEAALAGVKSVTAQQQAAAFADFVTAYTDLMGLVAPLGIIPAQPVSTPAVLPLVVDGGALPVTAAPMPAPRLVVPLPLAVRAARGSGR